MRSLMNRSRILADTIVPLRCVTPIPRSTSAVLTASPVALASRHGHRSAMGCQTRTFTHVTRPLWLEVQMNPASGNYAMEHAFEEPTLRLICEGIDVDFKGEVREALLRVMPPKTANFTAQGDQQSSDGTTTGPASASSPTVSSSLATLRLLRALCKQRLVSFAQVRSTPQRLSSFYETVATASPALAALAADHFTAAGMLATHGDKASAQQHALLDGADAAKLLGCLAQRELIADGAPYNTEARYDAHERCFVLRGTGKFALVAAEHADWAILTATLTLKKNENNGPHLFVVPLREAGTLCTGVSVRPISATEDPVMGQAGVAVIHFEDVRIPADSLLKPFRINSDNRLEHMGDGTAPSAVDTLLTRTRLATAAIYVGVLKTLMTNVVYFIAQKDVVGFDYRRNYPYFGLQHVQTPLVSTVAKGFVYLTGYQRLLPHFTGEGGKPASYEDHMTLAGTVHFLQQTIWDLAKFAHEFMGLHASLASSGVHAAMTTVHLRNEGSDQSALIREVALKSITKNIGTSHWGWWATSLLQSFPSLDRFIKNPLYSPRIAELGRHLIFFSHKHYGTKTRLRRSREFERRRGGSEHQWYDWVMFRHREVVHCGEAFMEMRAIEAVMAETQNCQDPRGRKVIRDLGWIFSLARQMDRLDYMLAHKLMSPNKAVVLASHLDNLVTVMAPQCVNLVDAMQVPGRFRAPCGAASIEPYWTIPGTNTHIQRGDRVTLYDAAEQRQKGGQGGAQKAKAEEEDIREEEGEFDLFHGLADEPSFAMGKREKRSKR